MTSESAIETILIFAIFSAAFVCVILVSAPNILDDLKWEIQQAKQRRIQKKCVHVPSKFMALGGDIEEKFCVKCHANYKEIKK